MTRQPMTRFFQNDRPDTCALESGPDVHRWLPVAAGRIVILFMAAAAMFGLAGCEDAARHAAVNHPAAPPAALARSAPARAVVRVDLLPLAAAGRARALLFPLRPPNGEQRVEQQVREELAAAQQDYQAGHVETARQEFERALRLLVDSGFEVRANPRLAALQQQIAEAERNAETVAANNDSFSAPKTAPRPWMKLQPAPQPLERLPRRRWILYCARAPRANWSRCRTTCR